MLEYYHDTLWKGMLLFAVSLFFISFNSQVRAGRALAVASLPPGPPPATQAQFSVRPSPRRPQVKNQETWGFFAYGMVVGLWLMMSSLPRRRLQLNHKHGFYHFSIQGHTVCQGPMHLIYVRLALNSDGDTARDRDRGRGRERCLTAAAPLRPPCALPSSLESQPQIPQGVPVRGASPPTLWSNWATQIYGPIPDPWSPTPSHMSSTPSP